MSSGKKSISLTQLLLLSGAVVVGILLFQLPKVAVNNSKDKPVAEKPGAARDQHSSTDNPQTIHKVSLKAEDKSLLMSLRTQYNQVSGIEKKRIFADSLIATYISLSLYDSVAVFMDEVLIQDKSRENQLKAGEAWVNAAGLVEGPEQQTRLEKGRAYYQQVLDVKPKDDQAMTMLAISYLGTEETMKGVMMLRDAAKLNPQNEDAQYFLGIMGLQSKQFDKAVDRFKQVVAINPKNAAAWFQLGIAYKGMGDKDNARKALLQAQSLDSSPEIESELEGLN